MLDARPHVIDLIDTARQLDEALAEILARLELADFVLNLPKGRVYDPQLAREAVDLVSVEARLGLDAAQQIELPGNIGSLGAVGDAVVLDLEDGDLVDQLADRDRGIDPKRRTMAGRNRVGWSGGAAGRPTRVASGKNQIRTHDTLAHRSRSRAARLARSPGSVPVNRVQTVMACVNPSHARSARPPQLGVLRPPAAYCESRWGAGAQALGRKSPSTAPACARLR